MKVLVTGGAGYIGSHTVVELVKSGMEPVIVDNFVNSHRQVLKNLKKITGREIVCHEQDVTDAKALNRIFAQEQPGAVIHFAALKAVGESVLSPTVYYHNNLLSTLSVCEAMVANGVKNIVFSSSASVYGETAEMPITEEALLHPISPYAQTKAMTEQILRDTTKANPGWNVVLLRYFNPVGAHESGLIGEDPSGMPNNLWPFIAQVASGKLSRLSIYGGDYDTPDGTGIRDYLHVVDLAQAHVLALKRLANHSGVKTYNLGTGRGHSVLEVLHAFEKATGKKIPYKIIDRRPGDLAVSYADPTLAKQELGWSATKTIEEMCVDGWRWQTNNPNGYLEAPSLKE